MATPKIYIPEGGIDTYRNALTQDGLLIHSVNMTSFPYGAKSKRTGYSTFLGTADGAQVNSLFSFPNIGNDATKCNLLRASGSVLYHSIQGTGTWTSSGNGTISNNAHFGHAITNGGTILIGGDGVGSTRQSTDGTSFTNTPLSPIAEYFEEYQNSIYAAGTASTLFKSSDNDGTNWSTSGTSNSSSFQIPGAGKLGAIYKTADKLISTKTSGIMHKWDGYSRIDMATKYGASSPYSVAKSEDFAFFINPYGNYGFGGARPQLLSNAIQRQFYNNENTGIAGTAFTTIPGEVHIYDYYASIGTITDDFTGRLIPNAIIKYDFQKNEYLNYSFANKPTAFHSYRDVITGKQNFIFGDTNGQCYKMDLSTTDNGIAIPSEMVFLFHYGTPFNEKVWEELWLSFNPGCQANIQIACTNTYHYQTLKWIDLGDCSSGFTYFRFPNGSRSRLLFMRIYESSKNSSYNYYGCQIMATIQDS
jgi:hypothetical protein